MAKKHVLDIYAHTPTHCIGCVEVSAEEASGAAGGTGGAADAPLGTPITYAGDRSGPRRDRRSLLLPGAALRVALALGVRREPDGKVVDYRIEVTLLHRPKAKAPPLPRRR